MISYSLGPMLEDQYRRELVDLAAAYGAPRVQVVDLGTNRFADPGDGRSRPGEVCMVIRRPSGRLLVFRKTFYPAGVYRLLTGGIHENERILSALRREVQEETGLGLEIRQFLAAIGYKASVSGSHPSTFTYAFLLDEVGGTLGAIDQDEHVEEFAEIEPGGLLGIADHLERLAPDPAPELDSHWDDWGRFRAVIHRVVWEVLI